MTETTGIPIIDRLDALRAKARVADRPEDQSYVVRYGQALADAYPDIKALVLRLQEERNEAKSKLRDEEERHAQLQARCYDGWPTGSSVFDELRDAEKQRDALLEALKDAARRLENCALATGDYQHSLAQTDAQAGVRQFREIIADVEGKE